MLETLTILILTGLLIFKELSFGKERKDLLDRIMAKTFTEYKDNNEPEPNSFEQEDDGTEDIEFIKKEDGEE